MPPVMAALLASILPAGCSTSAAPALLLRAFPRLRLRRPLASPPRMSSSASASPAPADAAGGERPTAAPFGSWRSPITADVVSGASKRLGDFALAGDGRLLWIEGRPEEKGRMVIVKEGDKPMDIIPQEFAARTLAQEYGGGAFAVQDNVVVFSNYKDQRLYKQPIGTGSIPVPLTPDYGAPDVSYADGVFDPHFSRYITVMEDRRTSSLNSTTTIVSVNLSNDDVHEPKVLISGNDFYASPRIDPTKKRMAWIEWGHPNMPWDKSELWVGYFSESGFNRTINQGTPGYIGKHRGLRMARITSRTSRKRKHIFIREPPSLEQAPQKKARLHQLQQTLTAISYLPTYC